MNIKEQCLKMISLNNHQLDKEFLNKCTAFYIADKLDMSRNLISSYLNQYFMEGLVIKVGKKPVSYLLKKELPLKENSPCQFNSLEELNTFLKKEEHDDDIFIDLIGANGSLFSILQACCSAISYPLGLSILLYGPTGTGKSFIALKLYMYAKEHGIIKKDAKFLTANCSEYANNPEFFLTSLFGSIKGAYTGADNNREGLLSLADGGILFLDEIQSLPYECQEKLFLFMDKGIYHMVGDDTKIYKSSLRLIFATTENPKTALLKTLHRRIAMKVKIPSLLERPLNEKKELITSLIRIEEKKVKKEIKITKRLYDILVSIDYPENIGQLSSVIRSCVARAYHKKSDLVIDIADMPMELLNECANTGLLTNYVSEEILSIETLEDEQRKEVRIYLFNRDLINLIDEEKNLGKNEIWRRIQKRFKQYLDAVVFGEHLKDGELAIYRSVIEMITKRLSSKYNIAFENNEITSLALLLADYRLDSRSLIALLTDNEKQIASLNNLMGEIDSEGQPLAVDFAMMINRSLNIETDDLFLLDFSIYLHILSKKVEERETRCIILSHGYSTASSMAQAVNHMIDTSLFDAIDMPTDVTISEIAEKMARYIENKQNLKDLIIFVDMGSLEEINKRLPLYKTINFLIINNVSMKLALDVGFKVKQSLSIDKISEAIEKTSYKPSSKYIENRKKKKAILTVCATGMATAEKISQLLHDSLPLNKEIIITEYGFSDLKAEKEDAAVFKKYDVLFIVGTLDPCITGYDFISVEEMIAQKNLDRLASIMNGILDYEELSAFTEKMIKNFSFQNLLDYLTIINPKVIINYVEDIITYLKTNLDIVISSSTAVGLYIHISCLIERLITDRNIISYENLDQFKKDHQDFIKNVKKAFEKLEKNYCVKIPDSEIAYIYEYIYSQPKSKVSIQSVEDSLF